MSQKIISCTTPMKPLGGVEKQRNERGSHNENLNRGTAPICRAQHMGVSTSRLSNQIEISVAIVKNHSTIQVRGFTRSRGNTVRTWA